MRLTHAHRATGLIAALIVAACALFAWIRSHEVTVVSRKHLRAADAAARGAGVFANDCQACHATLPRVGRLASAGGGRDYLVRLLLYGIDGDIAVEGARRAMVHPAFGELADNDLAAALNHVLSQWGNETALPARWKPYAADDIAAARARVLSPGEVLATRPRTDLK